MKEITIITTLLVDDNVNLTCDWVRESIEQQLEGDECMLDFNVEETFTLSHYGGMD